MPTQKVISIGAKEFLQGISPLQQAQNEIGGGLATATAIDLYKWPGMISPGPKAVATSTANFYTSFSVSDGTYFYGQYTKGNATNGLTRFTLPPNLTLQSSHAYSGVIATIPGHSILKYPIAGTNTVFAFVDTNIVKASDDVSSLDEDWGSTIPAGAAVLQSARHRGVIFNGILYFTNGRYIGTLDGTVGANGTLNPTKLALPVGFTANDIKVVQGNLEIYYDNGGEAWLGIWDGVATLPNETVPLEDSTVQAGQLVSGLPFVLTRGSSAGLSLRQKNYWGYPQLEVIKDGTNIFTSGPHLATESNGQLVVGSTNGNTVWTYGTPFPQYSYREDNSSIFPIALNQPIVTAQTLIGALTALGKYIVVSSQNGAGDTFALETFDITNTTNTLYSNSAAFQTNFIALPNDTSIDWIRFVMMPLLASSQFTPIVYTDMSSSGRTLTPDLSANNLDANGNSKTYYDLGIICDSIAIGGNWANSDSTLSVIVRIDIGVTIK